MNQPHHRIAVQAESWSPWEQAVVASSRGACSRSSGQTSVVNPYLRPLSLPASTGQAHAAWFNNCDAWWRGWDAEDARIRERCVVDTDARGEARALRRQLAQAIAR